MLIAYFIWGAFGDGTVLLRVTLDEGLIQLTPVGWGSLVLGEEVSSLGKLAIRHVATGLCPGQEQFYNQSKCWHLSLQVQCFVHSGWVFDWYRLACATCMVAANNM